jgi:hypothetical protein
MEAPHNEHNVREKNDDVDRKADNVLQGDDNLPCDNDGETRMNRDDDADEDEDVEDDDDTVEEEHFNCQGLWVPGGFVRDNVLENIMAAQLAPIVNMSLLDGTDFSDDNVSPVKTPSPRPQKRQRKLVEKVDTNVEGKHLID